MTSYQLDCGNFHGKRTRMQPLLWRRLVTILLAGLASCGPGGTPRGKVASFVPPTPEQMRDQPAMETALQILRQEPDFNDPAVNAEVSRFMRESEAIRKKAAWEKAKQLGLPTNGRNAKGTLFELQDFEGDRPIYLSSDNHSAAISSGIDQVRRLPDGPTLDGSGLKVGVWELESARLTHQEFKRADGSSRIVVKDAAANTPDDHATHVVGTLAAAGVDPLAKGMAPGLTVDFYDTANGSDERRSAAASRPDQTDKLLVGNGSYAVSSIGWSLQENLYTWYGDFSDDGRPANDIEFNYGAYGASAEMLDRVAVQAPYFLMVVGAGNGRDAGPKPGERWLCRNDYQTRVYDPARHPPNNSILKYRTLGNDKTAKNVLVVGAVTAAVDGDHRNTGRAAMTTFSNWGPAEDGRIKPDVVAQGMDVFSAKAGNDTSYGRENGTSMACPVVAGAAILLQQLYKSRSEGGTPMVASTLKSVIIHTADDFGTPGPDYESGWGLVNAKAAADVITAHFEGQDGAAIINDHVDKGGATKTYDFSWDGSQPLRVTLCWTDPAWVHTKHANPLRNLVNDLDLSVVAPDGTTVHRPYVMPFTNGGSFDEAAVRGVNHADNVEQVYVPAPLAAGKYRITIAPTDIQKGTAQDFSLVVSGNEPPPSATGGPFVKLTLSDYRKYYDERRLYFLQLAEPGDLRQLPIFKDKPELFNKVYGVAFYRRFRTPQVDQQLRFRPGIAGGVSLPSQPDAIYLSPETSKEQVQKIGVFHWPAPNAYRPPDLKSDSGMALRPMDPSDPRAPRSYAYSVVYYNGPASERYKPKPSQLSESPLSSWTTCEVVPLLAYRPANGSDTVLLPDKRYAFATNTSDRAPAVQVCAFLRINRKLQVPNIFLDWRTMLPDAQAHYIYRYKSKGWEGFSMAEGTDNTYAHDPVPDPVDYAPGTYALDISLPLGERTVEAHFDVTRQADAPWQNRLRELTEERARFKEAAAHFSSRKNQGSTNSPGSEEESLASAFGRLSEAYLRTGDIAKAEANAREAEKYYGQALSLSRDPMSPTRYSKLLAKIYYAWHKPEEYLAARRTEEEEIRFSMRGGRNDNGMSLHWADVAVEYFRMTGNHAEARKFMQKSIETSSPRTSKPELLQYWWEDPRKYRSPIDPPPQRLIPRVINPDPLLE